MRVTKQQRRYGVVTKSVFDEHTIDRALQDLLKQAKIEAKSITIPTKGKTQK